MRDIGKIALVLGILLLLTISFHVGYSTGQIDTLRIVAQEAPNVLNITLTTRAKQTLEGNPMLVMRVLDLASIDELALNLEKSGKLKGGIGPEGDYKEWNLSLLQEDI